MNCLRFAMKILLAAWVLADAPPATAGQPSGTGTLRGTVTIRDNGAAVVNASVTILRLGLSAATDGEGRYQIRHIPPGKYNVSSHMHALADEVRIVDIVAGQESVADFQLSFAPLRHQIIVTATGREETAFESFQAATSLDAFQLVGKNAFSLGEVVKGQPGVNTRSFGPGSARPVLRGFDGDRVLILADGLPTGTLSSQSGEHAEPIDPAYLDRLEIVKGPATLLYGSNAIGGVVNAVTSHHLIHEHAHAGLRGQVTVEGGSNHNRAAGGAGAEYGFGNWIVWGHGSRQAAGDYYSPEGRVDNSRTRMTSGNVGFGWFGHRPFFNLGYYFNKGLLGIPFAGEFHHHSEAGEPEEEHDGERVDQPFAWQNVRLTAGMHHLGGAVEKIKLAANFSRWMHKELEGDVVATAFDNKQINLRTTLDQARRGRLSGSLGFQFSDRDYRVEGEESLAPPTTSNGVALFALQQLTFERAELQFGARLEHARYSPAGLPKRSFTGVSGAAGFNLKLSKASNFVTHYTHSFRVPALEELYNYGPHIGNLAFEIGNPNLKREAADGFDVSLRHHGDVVHAQANFFFYHIRDFVYLAFTDEVIDGLRAADFAQADSRFAGGEAEIDLAVHSNLWLKLGMDTVRAELRQSKLPLPRIPPLRGRVGADLRYKGFMLNPELVVANAQERIYPTETRTPGYTVVNLDASYIHALANHAHVFAVSVSNAADRLYRNHLSFIKDLAPEMGRALRFSYSLRFF
ncbi:MAG: TonB-dependent receptor [Acidobacteria bacterium]|nr:TonB-dependent receptor [Acidobacteriota bacterium]